MHSDPYSPPETDVRVSESLPARPVRGVAVAILFSFVASTGVGVLISLLVSRLLASGTAEDGVDVLDRMRQLNYVFLAQLFLGLVISFVAGYICVAISRSRQWLYPAIVACLNALPAIAMVWSAAPPITWPRLGGMLLGFLAILVGAKAAMKKLKGI